MSQRTRADSPTKDCTHDGCTKPMRAKGLCSTHYNQTQPDRHGKTAVICDCCGKPVLKEARARRYVKAYCSELCRQWVQWGAWSSELPPDHWVFMSGKSCEYNPGRFFDCAWCGAESLTYRDDTRYCSDACARRQARRTRRAREHGAQGTYSWAEVTRLWRAFNKSCAYCHTPTSLADIQAEHVHPLSKGGRNDLTNLLPSCGPCNSDKRDLLLTQWNQDRSRRGLPLVTVAWTHGDPRYAHLVQYAPLLVA